MATPIDIVVFKCRKICRMRDRWNHALFTWHKKKTKFRLPQTIATVHIVSQNLPLQATDNVLIVHHLPTIIKQYKWTQMNITANLFLYW